MLYHKENLRLLGRMFKNRREGRDYSLRGVARSVGVAHAMISQIENCRLTPHEETIAQLFEAVGSPFYRDPQQLRKLRRVLDAFYEAIYQASEDDVEMYFDALRAEAAVFLRSPLRVSYLLALETERIFSGRDFRLGILDELEDYYDHLSAEQRQLFDLLKGWALYEQGRHQEALVYLERSCERPESKHYHALSVSLKAKALDQLDWSHQTLKTADTASKLHVELNNLPRKVEMNLLVLKKHIDLWNLETAEQHIQGLRQVFEGTQDLDHALGRRFYLYRAYHAYAREDFQEALAHLERIHDETPQLLFFKGYLSHQLGRVRDALVFLESVSPAKKKRLKDDLYIAAAELFLWRLKQREPSAEASETLHRCIHQTTNIFLRIFMIGLLLAYYEYMEDFETAYQLLRKQYETDVENNFYAKRGSKKHLEAIMNNL